MNDDDYESLFILLGKCAKQEDRTWRQKRDEIVRQAKALDATEAVNEFVSWFNGDPIESED